MKTLKFKPGLLILLSFLSLQVFAYEGEKTVNKEFPANNDTRLELVNKYGNVDIVNWDQDQIAITVTIQVKSSNKEAVQEALEEIHIVFRQEGNTVRAETQIPDNINKGGGFFGIFQNAQKDFQIDYDVKAPDYISLDLSNKYGNAFVETIRGHARIDIKYGNFKIHELSYNDADDMNDIILGYGDGEIKRSGWLRLAIKYSKLEVGTASSITGETKYSKLYVDQTQAYLLESKYDEHKLGSLNDMVMETAYSDIVIDELRKKLDLVSKYTDCRVEKIPAGFASVNIDNAYGNIDLNVDESAPYQLDAELSYCNIRYPESSKMNVNKDMHRKSVSGIVGDESAPASKIIINSKYGDVSL